MDRQRASDFRLPRRMILRGRTPFRLLFEEGHTLRAGRILLKYRLLPRTNEYTGPEVVTAFIVGKRHGRAVDRNRARRLMRENWRLARPEFLQTLEQIGVRGRLEIGLIWSGPPAARSRPRFEEIAGDLERANRRLLQALEKNGSNMSEEPGNE